MAWDMRDARNVRFLAVSGTIWVGDCQTTYNFTLVEYELYIDEVPWLIFSTLADTLEEEFDPAFWDTVNYGRKERWGFLDIPWDGQAYDVAPPYIRLRLSLFNAVAHTMRVVQPFVWNQTHLRVHPNGAAVFHEQKKLAFLLPLIVDAHELIPPKPLFWVNDDKTIPLWRTTLWTHEETIQWLFETGETYPLELREEIQPRLDQLKSSQPMRRAQPPTPPPPTRWGERSAPRQQAQPPQATTQPEPKDTKPTPQQVADRDLQYMELQSAIAQANERTVANSRPAKVQQTQKPTNLLAASQQSTEQATAAVSANPVSAERQKLHLRNQVIRQLKSMHNLYLTKDQAHHRLCPRRHHKRIPRVPVRYPPTVTLLLITKMKSSNSLQSSLPSKNARRQKNRRLQVHKMNRQSRQQLTLLGSAALSPSVNPD